MCSQMNITIKGDIITLRSLQQNDLDNRVKWFNDPEVNKNLILDSELNLGDTIKWFNNTTNTDTRRDFVIETADRKGIGCIGLRKINTKNKSGCFYIVIGEKDYWGKGIGSIATSLLLAWGFANLGLNKIWSVVRSENTGSLSMLKKVGFKEEELLRQEECVKGLMIDVVRLGLLKSEWETT